MWKAIFYRSRLEFKRSPGEIVKYAFVLLYIVGMTCMSLIPSSEAITQVDKDACIGVIKIVWFLLGVLVLVSTCDKGLYSFSTADVTFQLAGPFSKKCNLMYAVYNSILNSVFYLYFVSILNAFVNGIGFTFTHSVIMLLGSLVIVVVGSLCGFIIKVLLEDSKYSKLPKNLIYIFAMASILGAGADLLSKCNWNFDAVKELGVSTLIDSVGNSVFLDLFPFCGWMGLVLKGAYTHDTLLVVVGVFLILMVIGLICFVLNKAELDFYETAVANAEKLAEMIEKKKTDAVGYNQNGAFEAKVGKETFDKGQGASAIFYRHLLENKRRSHFSFINLYATIYKLAVVLYLIFYTMSNTNDKFNISLFMGLGMGLMMNLFCFTGGKTITEFSKPYIYLIPDNPQKKLFYCIASDIPEMAVDGIILTAILAFFSAEVRSVLPAISLFLMITTFNFLCETITILCIRIIRGIGPFLLLMIKMFVIMSYTVFAVVVGSVITFVTHSPISVGILIPAGFFIIGSAIAIFCSRNILTKTEMR